LQLFYHRGTPSFVRTSTVKTKRLLNSKYKSHVHVTHKASPLLTQQGYPMVAGGGTHAGRQSQLPRQAAA